MGKYSPVPKGIWIAKLDSGSYQVMSGPSPTRYVLNRNDNELAPGGSRDIAWQVDLLEAFWEFLQYQTGSRASALAWVTRVLTEGRKRRPK